MAIWRRDLTISFPLSFPLMAADAFRAIAEDVTSASQILLNFEYESNGIKMASILNASNKEDVVKGLISEGGNDRIFECQCDSAVCSLSCLSLFLLSLMSSSSFAVRQFVRIKEFVCTSMNLITI